MTPRADAGRVAPAARSSLSRPESRLRSSSLRNLATGVLLGEGQLSLTEATVLFATTARDSSKSADDVARDIIRHHGLGDRAAAPDPRGRGGGSHEAVTPPRRPV